jgi:aspartokinase
MGCGAKILQAHAVELAAEHKIPLAVGNSKTGVAGTIVTDKPLVRQTLTAVNVTEKVDCLSGLTPEDFFTLLDKIRDCGLSPLMSFRFANTCAVALRSGEGEYLKPLSCALDNNLDLVTLIGPGVTSNNELARAIRGLLKNYEPSVSAVTATATHISLLMAHGKAKLFAMQAHELCLKLPVSGVALTPQ